MLKQTVLLFILGLSFSNAQLFAQEAATEQATETQQDEQTVALTEQLLGVWNTASMQIGANPAPKEISAKGKFVFTNETLTITGFDSKDTVCEYVIDGSQTPATIKFKPPEETEWVAGIVKIGEDGQATMCLARPGSELPTEFATGADTPRVMLAVFEKAE